MITENNAKEQLFQWVRGDQMGKIVKAIDTVIDDNMEFFVFEDGSQCNTQLVGEWITPIASREDAPYLPDPVPAKKQPKPETAQPAPAPAAAAIANPVHDLLKMSKKKTTKMQVTVTVEMPSEELIKVINESYQNGSKLIGDYLVSSIDQQSILTQLDSLLRAKVDEVTKKKKRNENTN